MLRRQPVLRLWLPLRTTQSHKGSSATATISSSIERLVSPKATVSIERSPQQSSLRCTSNLTWASPLSWKTVGTEQQRLEHPLISPAVTIGYARVNRELTSGYGRLNHPVVIRRRWLTSSVVVPLSKRDQPVRILYASQGGTAMLFAQDLKEALEALDIGLEIDMLSWNAVPPEQLLQSGQAFHIFLVSTAGVGDPPDNGRAFYQWIMNQADVAEAFTGLEYTVFGLGNSKAHPNHFNAIGKGLDAQLERLGARRILEFGIGDDGDCIEDDFDKYMEKLVTLLQPGAHKAVADDVGDNDSSPAEAELSTSDSSTTTEDFSQSNFLVAAPGISLRDDGMCLRSSKYAPLKLIPAQTDVVREDLFHLQGTSNQFYMDTVQDFQVTGNQSLATHGCDTALREIKFRLKNPQPHDCIHYETGDHLMVYPKNSPVLVRAYLEKIDVDPNAIVAPADGVDADSRFPHPTGLTLTEILTHCVDLSAPPSPSFARTILGRKDIDYKTDIAHARRTTLDLLAESSPDRKIPLEDLLYELSPMKPRYYSIASSSLSSPNEVALVVRPVKYVTNRGILREGVCSTYLVHLTTSSKMQQEDVKPSAVASPSIPAVISSNPSFRLPKSRDTPILMIASGCGVAPIRAFVQERVAMKSSNDGPFLLYLGFRSPEDEVYREMFANALSEGAISDVKVWYSQGCRQQGQNCMEVEEMVRNQGQDIWRHWESGGVTYLCGGARTFGVAVEAQMIEVFQTHGNMSFDDALSYLRKLREEGRLHEDFAD